METETIIKEFLTKMATQDNRATAAPYFYVIRTKVSDPAPTDNCDRTGWYWNDSTYDTYELLEEAVREAGYDKDELANAQEYGIKDRWEHRGMFLTEDDAETHLKLNHYHYSPDAHTYVDHAWRAPKLTEFFKALNAHFGIEVKR